MAFDSFLQEERRVMEKSKPVKIMLNILSHFEKIIVGFGVILYIYSSMKWDFGKVSLGAF
jgi:hypothetical protein